MSVLCKYVVAEMINIDIDTHVRFPTELSEIILKVKFSMRYPDVHCAICDKWHEDTIFIHTEITVEPFKKKRKLKIEKFMIRNCKNV